METHRINLYCNLTNQVLVETGVKDGVRGYWFSAFDGTRSFRTDDDINGRLDAATAPVRVPAQTPREAPAAPRPQPAFA